MGDTQDVNDQHLASMGLTGVSLGLSYSGHNWQDRCPAIDPETGMRCVIKVGHPSHHARGTRRWSQTLTETLVVEEPKVDLTDEPQVFDLLDEAWPQSGGRFDILLALTRVVVEQAKVR